MTDLTELFCIVHDFEKEFEPEWKKMLISSPKVTRSPGISMSEIITILIFFHSSSFRNFKAFYQGFICLHYKKAFPHLPSYNRFVELKKRVLFPMQFFLFCLFGKSTGINFVDSTSIKVCHYKRSWAHKVFKGIAKAGHTSMGRFFGLKLHLITNDKGELLNVLLTPGNIDDRVPVEW